jgi:hypothetical protein
MEQAPIAEVVVVRVPTYAPPDILWYFGALVAAFAGDALILEASPSERGVWTLLVGLVLIAVFAGGAAGLLASGLRVPGGVLAAAAVWLVPATEVGFERLFGVHPGLGSSSSSVSVGVGPVRVNPGAVGGGFHGAWFSIAIGTVIVGVAVFWLVRFAFVLLPVVLALVAAAQLFLPAVVKHPSAGDEIATALITGIVFCVLGLLLDARLHRRYAFWWYVVGLFEVAIAFTYYLGLRHHEWVWVILLVVAAVVLLASAPLRRATWATYAVIGIYATLVHYADDATGSWRTPLVFTAIGLVLVLVGVVLEAAGATFVDRITRVRLPRP